MPPEHSSDDDIVVTGVGLVSPLGNTLPQSWDALIAGKGSGRWLTDRAANWHFPGSETERFAGCPVHQPMPGNADFGSRLVQLAGIAAREAVGSAGGLDAYPTHRRACCIGTSKTDLAPLDQAEFSMSILWPSHAAAEIAARFQCEAASLCPVAACATGVVSLLSGADQIRYGTADVVIAGSVDASLHPALLSSYRRLGVMARPGNRPEQACRPFDQHRSGFLVGEGGAAFVLERASAAVQRGARPLAILRGGGFGCDPSGMTLVDESGQHLAAFIERMLDRLQLRIGGIDSICLHGTATRPNDLAEARALQRLLGSRLGDVPAFATKGATGHLMGAAGAVETAFAVQSLQAGVIPPTTNLQIQDRECGVRLSSQSVHATCRRMLKLSLGFGGHIAAAVLERP
ncbi:MAG: beta-ketoacyl-[acyl-carrier-protein] synthase family protein [Planctomycetaceae bacterium]|nr:beta-ketoacyl-[acyl-carrier-protein] synthase family protein [Planctomycetaceae bacterium]